MFSGGELLFDSNKTWSSRWHEGEDSLPHVTSIEYLFDSNKDTGEMTSVVAQGDSQSLSVAGK